MKPSFKDHAEAALEAFQGARKLCCCGRADLRVSWSETADGTTVWQAECLCKASYRTFVESSRRRELVFGAALVVAGAFLYAVILRLVGA